jgi:hypothetical protein
MHRPPTRILKPYELHAYKLLRDILKATLKGSYIKTAEAKVPILHSLMRDPKLPNNVVLITIRGTIEDIFLLSFIRFMQILFVQDYGDCFYLKVALLVPGMQPRIRKNIESIYRELALDYDPRVILVNIDNEKVKHGAPDDRMSGEDLGKIRETILAGVHTHGLETAWKIFSNYDHHFVNWRFIPAILNPIVDILITGNSNQQSWTASGNINGTVRPYLPGKIIRFNIFEGIQYDKSVDPIDFLESYYMSFDFDSLLLNFPEADEYDPVLLAYLRGLQNKKLHGISYRQSFEDYKERFRRGMLEQGLPAWLIIKILANHSGILMTRRTLINTELYIQKRYHFTNDELVCMAYRPFINNGKNLGIFLRNEHPSLIPEEITIRELLSGNSTVRGNHEILLIQKMEQLSGLSFEKLQSLCML